MKEAAGIQPATRKPNEPKPTERRRQKRRKVRRKQKVSVFIFFILFLILDFLTNLPKTFYLKFVNGFFFFFFKFSLDVKEEEKVPEEEMDTSK